MTGSGPGAADALIEAGRTRIEAALERLAGEWLEPVPADLREPIRYALARGGKRLRPLLCVRTHAALAGGDCPAPVYDAAVAIEWIHAYSLAHDDLPCMDDDDLRRGRPTLHRAFDVRRATVAGAIMIPIACGILETACRGAGLGPTAVAATVRELTAAAGAAGMVGGQVLDLEAESRQLGLAALESIHRMKTGALFGAAFRVGGRLAHADGVVLDALGRAGTALGLAFQVTDDVLDVTGTTGVLGKRAGSDREHRKATYPALLGLGRSVEMARHAADSARAALGEAGVADPVLDGLIDFAVNRDR